MIAQSSRSTSHIASVESFFESQVPATFDVAQAPRLRFGQTEAAAAQGAAPSRAETTAFLEEPKPHGNLIARAGAEAAQRAAAAAGKPPPEAADALRREFIVSKYVRRLYSPLPRDLPGGTAQAALWDAAENGDVR